MKGSLCHCSGTVTLKKGKKEMEIMDHRGDPCNLAVLQMHKATFLVSPISPAAICAEADYVSGQNINVHSINALEPLK